MLVYLAAVLLGGSAGRSLWILCVDADEPTDRLVCVLAILTYSAAIYGVLRK